MTRGEVWTSKLDPVQGSEQAGTRPVVILQADPLNVSLRTVVVVPFTTNLKWARLPYCVRVAAGEGGLSSDSAALGHQVRVCDKGRLDGLLGKLSPPTMAKVEQAVRVALAL